MAGIRASQHFSRPPSCIVPPTNACHLMSQTSFIYTPRNGQSVLLQYGLRPVNWVAQIQNRQIRQHDLKNLVTCAAFWFDNKFIWRSDKNLAYRAFVCRNCKQFKLSFACTVYNKDDTGGNFFFLVMDRSVLTHSDTCPKFTLLKKRHFLIHCPLLAPYFEKHIFRSTYQSALNKKTIISFLQTKYGVNLDLSRTGYSLALQEMTMRFFSSIADDYATLPAVLKSWMRLNPDSVVALEDDMLGAFYRMYVSVPRAADCFKELCLPLLYIDGTFCTSPGYDGVMVMVVGKSGYGKMIILATAWVPNESERHMIWVLRMIRNTGLPISDVPIFCDRGNLLHAAITFHHIYKSTLTLVYCLEHILRNIVHRFKIPKSQMNSLRYHISRIQGAPTFSLFMRSIEDFFETFDGKEWVAKNVALYLLSGIHPSHWTTFAMRKTENESIWEQPYIEFLSSLMKSLGQDVPDTENIDHLKKALINDPVPIGKQMPTFGNVRNNLSEGAAYCAKNEGIRSMTPPKALIQLLITSSRQMRGIQSEHGKYLHRQLPLTNIGIKIWSDARSNSQQCSICEIQVDEDTCWGWCTVTKPLNTVQAVTRLCQVSQHTVKFTWNLLLGWEDSLQLSCSCLHYERYGLLCPHGLKSIGPIARIFDPSSTDDAVRDLVHKLLPSWCQVKKVEQFFSSFAGIILEHLDPESEFTALEELLLPPPAYRKKTSASARRFKSKGETGPGQTQASPRSRTTAARHTTTSAIIAPNNVSQNLLNVFEESLEEGYFDLSQVDKPMPICDQKIREIMERGVRTRHLRRCSQCNDETHNVRRCPHYLNGGREYREPKTIRDGHLVVQSAFRTPTCDDNDTVANHPNSVNPNEIIRQMQGNQFVVDTLSGLVHDEGGQGRGRNTASFRLNEDDYINVLDVDQDGNDHGNATTPTRPTRPVDIPEDFLMFDDEDGATIVTMGETDEQMEETCPVRNDNEATQIRARTINSSTTVVTRDADEGTVLRSNDTVLASDDTVVAANDTVLVPSRSCLGK